MMEDKFYWYGIAAAVYIVTCWVFSVVRAVHNCGTPKERRDYIWPDRKMQVAVYLTATVLLPYVLNPNRISAYYSANLSITKEIGDHVSLSFYANNFLNNMNTVHSSQTDLDTSLFANSYIPSYYYGLSLRLKL